MRGFAERHVRVLQTVSSTVSSTTASTTAVFVRHVRVLQRVCSTTASTRAVFVRHVRGFPGRHVRVLQRVSSTRASTAAVFVRHVRVLQRVSENPNSILFVEFCTEFDQQNRNLEGTRFQKPAMYFLRNTRHPLTHTHTWQPRRSAASRDNAETDVC